MSYNHMCIDGKNAVYRAIFAGYYDKKFKDSGHSYFVIMMRFISNYISLFKPSTVNIFWDAHRSKTWRKNYVSYYKEHRDDKYKDLTINIRDELAEQVKLSIMIFKHLGCKQYYADNMEADDLMYSFCYLNYGKTILISSDHDFKQIPYRMNHVHIYNPLTKTQQVEPKPDFDITIVKSLMGDKSDNINGYHNIGPKKSLIMANDINARTVFLSSDKAVTMEDGTMQFVGDSLFKRNRKIIDLSWCPFVADNCEYVESKFLMPTMIDVDIIKKIIHENKVRGLLGDLPRHIPVFESVGRNKIDGSKKQAEGQQI